MAISKCQECGFKVTIGDLNSGKCSKCGATLSLTQPTGSTRTDQQSESSSAATLDAVGFIDSAIAAGDSVAPVTGTMASGDSVSSAGEGRKSTSIDADHSPSSETVISHHADDDSLEGGEIDEDGDPGATVKSATPDVEDSGDSQATLLDSQLVDSEAGSIFEDFGQGPPSNKNKGTATGSESASPAGSSVDHASSPTIASQPITGSRLPSIGESLVSLRKIGGLDSREVVRPDYEILSLLGEGGMGVVWEARQASINRSVALKMVKSAETLRGGSSRQQSPSKKMQRARQSLLTEAVINGNLTHPNIVPVHDLGQDDDGNLFYSMKRVEGQKWESVIRKKTEAENIDILLKVADAVAFAHSRGIVHCDLKPENVQLGEFAEVLLMDWGLACVTERFAKRDSVLVVENPGGSPAYMAPEQARNFLVHKRYLAGSMTAIGPATDVYLLGAILFQILTSKPPHLAPKVTLTVVAASHNEIIPPENVQPEYRGYVDIAMKAMATDASERYQSVKEFQDAIREHRAHEQSLALLSRANEHFSKREYARTVTICEDALELWPANDKAESRKLLAERRLRRRRNMVGTLAVSLMLAILAGTYLVNDQRLKAVANADEANTQKGIAEKNEQEAKRQEGIAKTNEEKAKEQEGIAKEKTKVAEEQTEIARLQTKEAEKQAGIAQLQTKEAEKQAGIAQKNAEEARAQEQIAVKEAGRASIRLAKSQIDSNLYDAARQTLALIGSDEIKASWEYRYLNHILHNDYLPLDAKSDVNAVVASPSGQFVITGVSGAKSPGDGADAGEIQIWGTDFQFQHDNGDGKQNGNGLKPEATLKHGAAVRTVAVTRDGNLFATAGDEDSFRPMTARIRIWQRPDPNQPFVFEERPVEIVVERNPNSPHLQINSIAISPDAKTLLAAVNDGYVHRWNIETGIQSSPLRPDQYLSAPKPSATNVPNQVAFSPDGSKFVVAHNDGHVYGWEFPKADSAKPAASNTSPTCAGCFYGHRKIFKEQRVLCVAFGPEDAPESQWRIVSGGEDGHLLYWTWDQLSPLPASQRDESRIAGSTQASRARSGNNAAANESDPLSEAVERIKFAGFMRESDKNAKEEETSDAPAILDFWDDKIGKLQASLFAIRSVAFAKTADGRTVIVSAGDDSVVRAWLPPKSKQDESDPLGRWKVWKRVRGQSYAISSFAVVSPSDKQGDLFIVAGGGGEEKRAHCWNLTSLVDQRVDDVDVISGNARGLDNGVNEVFVAKFLPDGNRLLTTNAEEDQFGFRRFVVLSDLSAKGSGNVSFTEGHHYPMKVARVISFPTGDKLLSVGTDETAIIWDKATGNELGRIEGIGTVGVAALSHDGKWIATGGTFQSDSRTGKALASQFALLWKTDEVLAHRDHREELKPVASLDCVSNVASLAFSPDDKLLLVGDADGKCYVWTVDDQKPVTSADQKGTGRQLHGAARAKEWVLAARFISAGEAVTVGSDGSIVSWNPRTGEATAQRLQVPRATGQSLTQVAISPDGTHVAVFLGPKAGKEAARSLQVWDCKQRKILWQHEPKADIASLEFSPDGKQIVSASRSANVSRPAATSTAVGYWGASDGKQAEVNMEFDDASKHSPEYAAFTPDGQSIVTVRVTDAAGGIVQQKAEWWKAPAAAPESSIKPERVMSLTSVVVSADITPAAEGQSPEYVLTANVDGTVNILAASDLRLIEKVDTIGNDPWLTISVSPISTASTVDGKRIYRFLVGAKNGTVGLFDLAPKSDAGGSEIEIHEVATWKADPKAVWATAFSADGKWLLSGGQDGRLFARREKTQPTAGAKPEWDEFTLTSGTDGAAPVVRCATFVAGPNSADGPLAIASGSEDGFLRIWRVAEMTKASSEYPPSFALAGHTDDICAMRAFAHGKNLRIITAGKDATTTIWDADALLANGGKSTGGTEQNDASAKDGRKAEIQQALNLRSYHSDLIRAVDYSPKRNAIVTAGADGRTILHDAGAPAQ